MKFLVKLYPQKPEELLTVKLFQFAVDFLPMLVLSQSLVASNALPIEDLVFRRPNRSLNLNINVDFGNWEKAAGVDVYQEAIPVQEAPESWSKPSLVAYLAYLAYLA
ncbi:hypothetical protein BASA81_015998 [Batrachochytrium salamandrivorans]|nr:hypothetical protein BASA81_015998 [Batrachochytrium salamandrivorans]